MTNRQGPLPEEALQHYGLGLEAGRLTRAAGQLERDRTREILVRLLPPPPAMILDVGGGPGVHALWLAGLGYAVHLIDAVPLHVEQALAASAGQPDHPLAGARVGDARKLEWPDGGAAAVLLLGPLYHLTERADRVRAWSEARRVVRPGGRVFAAGISRFASLLDGLNRGFLDDPVFARMVQRDLSDGQHRNPTPDPAYFTTAYFHRPEELAAEAVAAGLAHERTVAVEGMGWLFKDLDERWGDPKRRAQLMDAIRAVEEEPSMFGVSAHLLGIARRPD